jgi:hypothetical protein
LLTRLLGSLVVIWAAAAPCAVVAVGAVVACKASRVSGGK